MHRSPRCPPVCASIGFPDTGHTAHPNHPAASPERSGSSRHRFPLCPMWIPLHQAKALHHASSLPPRRPFPASRHIVPFVRCNSHNFLPHPADKRPFQAGYSAQSSRAFLRLFLPSTRRRAQNFLQSSRISRSTPASLTEPGIESESRGNNYFLIQSQVRSFLIKVDGKTLQRTIGR